MTEDQRADREKGRIRLGSIGALVLAASALVLSSSAAASDSGDSYVTCVQSANAQIHYRSTGPFTGVAVMTWTGTEHACDSSDPTIHSGVEVGRVDITYDCSKPAYEDRGGFTFYWDNGRRSVVRYRGVLQNGVARSFGRVIKGAFKGQPIWNRTAPIFVTPDLCLDEEGTAYLSAGGVGGIGRDPFGHAAIMAQLTKRTSALI